MGVVHWLADLLLAKRLNSFMLQGSRHLPGHGCIVADHYQTAQQQEHDTPVTSYQSGHAADVNTSKPFGL